MKWHDSSIFIVAALSVISAAKAENYLSVQSGAWSCTATNVHGVAYTKLYIVNTRRKECWQSNNIRTAIVGYSDCNGHF
jgi:hypothetical protein